jgi:4-amino-4-deoxy-L-arabinose transferase-like glycosyltransferase
LKNTQRDQLEWRVSIGLLLFAVLFHLYFSVSFWRTNIQLYGDAVHYDHAAVWLLLKHIYSYWSWGPSAMITPGYPLFLDFAYWLTHFKSHNHQVEMHVAVTFQHLLAAGTVFLIYRIARFFLPRWASLIAALLWLFYPPSNWAADQLLTETVYVFFLILFVWTFLFALERKQIWRFALAGVALALATLVRPTVFPLVVAPLLFLLQRQNWPAVRTHLIHWLTYLGAFVVCMLPWWIRNGVVLHRLILTDDDMANPLLFGSDPNFAHDTSLDSGLDRQQQEHLAVHRIIEGFSHHPFQYAKWYTVDKLRLLFGSPWYLDKLSKHATFPQKLTFVFAHFHLAWVILGAIGLLLGAWRPMLRWISALALFLIVAQLPFIPINRYMFPTMPLMFIGVAALTYLVVVRIKERRQPVPNG